MYTIFMNYTIYFSVRNIYSVYDLKKRASCSKKSLCLSIRHNTLLEQS